MDKETCIKKDINKLTFPKVEEFSWVSELLKDYCSTDENRERIYSLVMEELAELIQQVSKVHRGLENPSHLAEEYADVLICLLMIKVSTNVRDTVIDDWLNLKVHKLVNRLELGEFK